MNYMIMKELYIFLKPQKVDTLEIQEMLVHLGILVIIMIIQMHQNH